MIVVWTPLATSDLDDVVDYISADSPDSALRVADKIDREVAQLSFFPAMGRVGEVPGTRELVFHPWSYIAVYEIAADEYVYFVSAMQPGAGRSHSITPATFTLTAPAP